MEGRRKPGISCIQISCLCFLVHLFEALQGLLLIIFWRWQWSDQRVAAEQKHTATQRLFSNTLSRYEFQCRRKTMKGYLGNNLVAHIHTHRHTQIGSPKRYTSTYNRHRSNLFMQTKKITGNMWASWHIFMAPTEALRGHAPRSPSMTLSLRLLSFYFTFFSMLYAFLLHSSNVSCVTACFFPVFGCFGCFEAMFCCPGGIHLSKIPHTATTVEGETSFQWVLIHNDCGQQWYFIVLPTAWEVSIKDCYSLVWSFCVCAPCFVATCSDELDILYNFYVWGLQCRSLSWQCVGPEFYGRLQWIVGREKNTTPKWKRCTWHLSSDFRLFSFACCEMVVDLLQE